METTASGSWQGPWLLVAFGAALSLGGLVLGRLLFRININAPMFAQAVKKMLKEGNLDRAIRLCAAAPYAPLSGGTREMLLQFSKGTTDSFNLREAFERGARGLERAVFGWNWLFWLALLAWLAGLILAIVRRSNPRPAEIGLGLAALAVIIGSIRKAYGIHAVCLATCDELIGFLQELPPKAGDGGRQ